MTFSEFINKLYKHCRNGKNKYEFILNFLKETSDADPKIFDEIDETTYRKYFNECTSNSKNKRGLPPKLASIILSNLNNTAFQYFISDNSTNDGLKALCIEFEEFIGPSTIDNIIEKIMQFYREILFKTANNENKKITNVAGENKSNFNKTVRDSGFKNVFIEAQQEKDLGLINNNQIKTFHLLVENKRFSLTGLSDFVKKNIGRYLYSRLQIDEFYSNQAEETIFSEAISILKSKGYSTDQLDDELGNIVIYIFLEHILNAPKIYTSIECSDKAINKTGLHLFKLNSQNLTFQMIFSKAYINDDLHKSIDTAFQDLTLIANSTDKHYKFLETSILGEKFDNATSNELKSIILPQKRKNEINVDKAYGILLGYSIDLDKTVNNEEYRNNLDKKMVDDLQNKIPYIVNKINETGLQNSSFYIYLLPLDDASKDKHTIMQNLIGGDS